MGVFTLAAPFQLSIRSLILQGAAQNSAGNVSGVNVTANQVLWPSITFEPGSEVCKPCTVATLSLPHQRAGRKPWRGIISPSRSAHLSAA